MEHGIYKRTFEALNFPKGSEERKQLNLCGVTSEYMPSYKYHAIGQNYSLGFKTKKEAETFYNLHKTA